MLLSNKLSLRFIILFAIFSFISFLFFSHIIREKYENDYYKFLVTLNNTIAIAIISNDTLNTNSLTIKKIINEINTGMSVDFTLFLPTGEVLIEANKNNIVANSNKLKNNIDSLKFGKIITGKNKILDNYYLYVTTPIYNKNNALIGIIRTSTLLKNFNTQSNSIFMVLFFVLFFLILVFIILKIFSSKLTNSIKNIEIAAKRFTAGNFNVRVEVTGNDELSSLSENFNIMVRRFKKLLDEVTYLERIRRDFIVNVSHELKTPLTAIKGFVETLEDEIADDKNIKNNTNYYKYIDIIKRHTHRLIVIVQDLLLLSETENSKLILTKSKTNVELLLRKLVTIFSQKLEEKNLKLEINFQPNFPKINVDAFKFEQIFVNLIDNAIKYSDVGTITISANYDKNKAIFVVKDNGIGISSESQTRIFERFYTADKSRSRKTGGTGIGLAIVKHIVILHNGEITVDSKFGVGSEFKVKLPIF